MKKKVKNGLILITLKFIFNLKYLGFINTIMISKYEDLSMLIKAIRDNQVDISKYNQSMLNKKGMKLTMFQSLFPVMDYLAKNNIKNQYSKLNHQG